MVGGWINPLQTLSLGGRLQRGLQRGLQTGHGRGLVVRLWSGQVQVQVWYRLQLKFNSFELDSEVGRLVFTLDHGW